MAIAARGRAPGGRAGMRLAGVEVVVTWSAAITALLVGATVADGVLPRAAPGSSTLAYWLAGAAAAAVFLLSLLAHEMSHALVARRFEVRVDRITLWMFGGMARMTSAPRTPGAEFAIAVAGPLTSFAVAALLLLPALGLDAARLALGTAVFAWLAFANLVLGVFNLLPAFPLDGGRVARALAWKVTGSMPRATHRAATLGRLFGIGLILLGLYWIWSGLWLDGLWSILLGWYLRQAASAEESGVAVSTALAGLRVSDLMQREPQAVPDWITVSQVRSMPGIANEPSALLVHGVAGTPTGVVSARRLATVAGGAADAMRVSELASPLAALPRLSPSDPVEEALARLEETPDAVAGVFDGQRLVGLLTPELVAAALRARGGVRPAA